MAFNPNAWNGGGASNAPAQYASQQPGATALVPAQMDVQFFEMPPLQMTGDVVEASGIKVLIYAGAGRGKTHSLSTTARNVVISCEGGVLSLQQFNMPFYKVTNLGQLEAIYQYYRDGKDGFNTWTISLDSVSEIAETCLAFELSQTKDGRKAYGEMADKILAIFRKFRDLERRNVIFTAKQGRIKDEATGAVLWAPMFPGNKLDQQVPYMFDEVFQLETGKDNDGNKWWAFRTAPDATHEAKDRSGRLSEWEPANFDHIFAKIAGTTT